MVDRDREAEGWVPGLYMLLELAVGGDLFDKIGQYLSLHARDDQLTIRLAPDVGVPDDLAKFYFAQMVSGIVSSPTC